MTRPICLALRASGIGDLLTAVPALRALADALPEHAVLVGCPGWLEDLVRLIPGVRGLVPVDGLETLPPLAPDVAVNLHGRGPQSHEALLSTDPRRLIAYRCDGVWPTGPVWRDGEHEVERWCRLLTLSGIPADPTRLSLSLPSVPAPVPDAAVVHVGGKDGRRRWATHRYAELSRRLTADGARVVLTGGAEDETRARQVADSAGLPKDAVLAGRLSLAETAALVASASIVVSGDTGVAHLASAYARPSVVVFGPESPERWGPPRRPIHRVLRGDPPAHRAADVTLPAVLEELDELDALHATDAAVLVEAGR